MDENNEEGREPTPEETRREILRLFARAMSAGAPIAFDEPETISIDSDCRE